MLLSFHEPRVKINSLVAQSSACMCCMISCCVRTSNILPELWSVNKIKEHWPFYNEINWRDVKAKRLQPTWTWRCNAKKWGSWAALQPPSFVYEIKSCFFTLNFLHFRYVIHSYQWLIYISTHAHSGASVEVKNKKGNTSLWLACNGGHQEVVRLLHLKGANVNASDNRGVTPLVAAFKKGHVQVSY